MRAHGAAALLALIAGCDPQRGNVLVPPSPDAAAAVDATAIGSCEEALSAGATGAACDGFLDCSVVADACCREIAVCEGGVLFRDRRCDLCPPCMSDRECARGTFCVSSLAMCRACPPVTCPPCGPGLAPLERNGCPTCTCGPPSQCDDARSFCPMEAPICALGALCTPGCADLACCSNVCVADPSCATPAPEGCATPCAPDVAERCGMECHVVGCDCRMGRWDCTAVCGPGALSCEVPPPGM